MRHLLLALAAGCTGSPADDKGGFTPRTDGSADPGATDPRPPTEPAPATPRDTGAAVPPVREPWSGGFGGASADFLWDLAVDPLDGSVVVVGKFLGLANFGGDDLESAAPVDPLDPTSDLFVAKYDLDGAHLWSHRFGGADDDGSLDADVAVDADSNVYIGTNFGGTVDFGLGPVTSAGESDAVVMQLDPSGTPVWVRAFGGPGPERIGGMGVDGDEVWVAGSLSDTVDPGAGPLVSAGGTDLFLAGWTLAGLPVAGHRYGGTQDEIGWDIGVAPGKAWMVGTYLGEATFGGDTFTSVGLTDTVIAEVDRASGDVAWARTWGGLTSDLAYAVAPGPLGPAVAGFFKGTVDFGSGPVTTTGLDRSDAFVVALDPAGATRWNRTFGGDEHDQVMSVAVHPSTGDVVIGGAIAGTVPAFWADGSSATAVGSTDAFLIRYAAADGAQVATDLYGCPEADTFRGVAIEGLDVYFGGHSAGAIVIDGVALDWHGDFDITLGRHPL